MTNAAWFNTPDDFFKHKVFISGERNTQRPKKRRTPALASGNS